MFFGVAVLLAMVIVFVATAPAGGVVGLLGPPDELEELLDPHAMMAPAAATEHATISSLLFIVRTPPIRPEKPTDVTSGCTPQ
jgi:hypothetical protein